MKNKIYYMVLVFILIASISLVHAADITSCNYAINLINQDPNPATPNSYVKLVFEVSGLSNCNGFAVKLDPQYPFSLDPGADVVQTITKTPYAQDYKSTWDIPYKVRVAQEAL